MGKWTASKAERFTKLTAAARTSRRPSTEVLACLPPRLLSDFMEAAQHFPHLNQAFRSADENAICPICSYRFVGRGSTGKLGSSCYVCRKTPEGKRLQNAQKATTLLKTYGSRSAAVLAINEARRRTSLAKYGVPFSFQAPEVKAKIVSTMLAKHGVSNPSKSSSIKRKKEETSLRNYGVANPLQSASIKSKQEATLRARYGVSNPSQVPAFQQKKINTCLRKRGVGHHLQDPTILEKSMLSSRSLYRVTTARRTYYVQGYERFAVSYLESKFKRVVAQFDQTFPSLVLKDKRCTYRPDFYIPKLTTYVEVKSTWTLLYGNTYAADARRKAKLAAEAGYNVALLLVFSKTSAVVLPTNWFNLSKAQLVKTVNRLKSEALRLLPQTGVTITKDFNHEEVRNTDLRHLPAAWVS